MLCYVMLCYVMLCYVMFYVVLCYVVVVVVIIIAMYSERKNRWHLATIFKLIRRIHSKRMANVVFKTANQQVIFRMASFH